MSIGADDKEGIAVILRKIRFSKQKRMAPKYMHTYPSADTHTY